jgi:hypothetical protein
VAEVIARPVTCARTQDGELERKETVEKTGPQWSWETVKHMEEVRRLRCGLVREPEAGER